MKERTRCFYNNMEELAVDCTNGTGDIPRDQAKAAYWRKLRDEMLSADEVEVSNVQI